MRLYSRVVHEMETLEPIAPPGKGRTLISRLFPGSDVAIARRARYLSSDAPRSAPAESSETKAPGEEESQLEASGGKATVQTDNYTDINGESVDIHHARNDPIAPTLGYWGSFFSMIAYSVALGVLSIPLTVATIGIVPFILLCVLFGVLTMYVGIEYWRITIMYPGVHNLEQAGDLLYGKPGAVIFSSVQLIFSIFLQGNHVLLGVYAFHYLGWHSCAVALAVVFAIISFVSTLPRSYKLFSIQASISFTSILTVVIVTMISSAVSGPQNKSPDDPPKRILAFGSTPQVPHDFLAGVSAVSNVFVSFGAHPSYMPIISEMRDRRQFPKSVGLVVIISFVVYVITGCVVNKYLGQYTKSPSLGSLTPTMVKVAYGLAIPTILVAGVASGHVSGKALFVSFFRSKKRRRFANNRAVTIIAWVVINIFTWTCAFILAELIPFFSSFLNLEASLMWSLLLAAAPLFYIWRHQHDYRSSWQNFLGMLFAFTVFGIAGFLCIAGVIAAAKSIHDQYQNGSVGTPFSCSMSD